VAELLNITFYSFKINFRLNENGKVLTVDRDTIRYVMLLHVNLDFCIFTSVKRAFSSATTTNTISV